jgi:quinol monooxygenase YgiN
MQPGTEALRTTVQLTEQIEGYLSYMDTLGFRPGPIGVFARIKAKSGRAAEIVAEIRKFEAIVRAEKSTLFYGLFCDAADKDLVHVYQFYADREALNRHFRDPGYPPSMNAIMNASDGLPEYRFGQPEFFHRGGL